LGIQLKNNKAFARKKQNTTFKVLDVYK